MGMRPGCRPALAAMKVARVRHAAVSSIGTVAATPARTPTSVRCNDFRGFWEILLQSTTTGVQPAMPARHDVMCESLCLLEQRTRTDSIDSSGTRAQIEWYSGRWCATARSRLA
jgi:hypothetical protein